MASGPRPTRRTLWLTLAKVLAVVLVATVVAELGTRAIASNLPPPGTDDRQEIVRKRDQLVALGEVGGADVVFLGNSPIDAGVIPSRVTTTSTRFGRAYNASLLGTPMYLQLPWATEQVIDRVDPSVAVVGMGPLDVVSGANPLEDDAEEISPGELALFESILADNFEVIDDSWTAAVERRLEDVSYLFRYRSTLRNPSTTIDAVGDTLAGESREVDVERPADFWDSNLTADGAVVQYHGRTGGQLSPLIGTLLDRSLATSYHPERIVEVFSTIEDRGVEGVLVIPPTYLPALEVETQERYRELVGRMVETADEAGIPVIVVPESAFGPEAFADAVHLNEVGAARLSDVVAAGLDALCAEGRLSCD